MALTFPFPDPPDFGEPVPLLPGMVWLRMKLPIGLDHINLWLMQGEDGWSLVDCGMADTGTRELWEPLLPRLFERDRLAQIILTHHHPDHTGLAGWLAQATGAPVRMSLAEWLTGRVWAQAGPPEFLGLLTRMHRAAGCDEATLEGLAHRRNPYTMGPVPFPDSFKRLREGDVVPLAGRSWEVMIGEGHSPEMLMFHCAAENMLIAADQVLPAISPNIGVTPFEPDGDPLGAFFASLEALRRLPADILVLPSHGLPFHGLHERIDQILALHRIRLDATLAACAESAAAVEILPRLFRRQLEGLHLTFAIGEALAHLNYLCARAEMAREIDTDGVHRFRRL